MCPLVLNFVPALYSFPVSLHTQSLVKITPLTSKCDELIFLNAGWIYHFNSIPQTDRDTKYWMERTYNQLYGEIKNDR